MALIIWGVYSLTRLPIDAVPDITNNQVQIITSSPSLAAQEVEQLITYPVEISMATIPDIKEIRSISRFGLSVVTIVFKDNKDIYLARQQVLERLDEAKGQIPEDAGTPKMAPVTTGLGEIYQYILHAKKGYEGQYNAQRLRTIEDWIVRRQLLGTPGVADVSSFGGFLKQYEIAINPQKLRAANITIPDIFMALEKNNQNTGGAYIEHGPNAYFIRTEGRIDSLEDIKEITVKVNPSGMPVLIRDVADVRLGHAVRYGAMTRNGQGEVVGGIVLMLKGGNSNQIIRNVKEKVKQIQKSLPEGVVIEPFLDRSELVSRAIHTVSKNLIEGALIVIFVLVVFLGNLRSGLLVASMIPLSMLFALGMMHIFGVSGNLMSLGALDFGLIVDGAVIIVEAIMHSILQSKQYHSIARLSNVQMSKLVNDSAGKMMSSAAFGQIIILIVYLPVLALTGIEGKMFRPMAETVTFAILGALILSLTYIPMMAAIVLPKQTVHKRNISDKIIEKLQKLYNPIIRWSLHHKWTVLSIAIFGLIVSGFIFSKMGSEFIPQLDEGDFAVEMRLLPGSSLSETIKASDKAAHILLKNFPEIKEVVGKIGSSEIPTDPMPVEACDLIIVLKNKKEWVTAHNREALADTMNKTLAVLPGVSFSFQQPIQMRFNELMTGAKQDVVIKIYGEDLDSLGRLADETGNMVRTIDGASDVYVEQISGLPQIVVHFNRRQIAQYGLNIADLNNTVQTAFAGKSAGVVFEGERRIDLVVRLDNAYRRSVRDFDDIFVPLPTGGQIPIKQVADIAIKDGPNQIQRDETRRRIMIGFNVRNRDVQSIVTEISRKIDAKVHLPPGYTITYGGQFENLVHARQRLSVALPAALLFIFILLFFAFGSVKQGLLIFTAIPLAAIGGILSLWLRGMPFSISAGVGFIALFGVAVLNGIVLISEFNRLKKEGVNDAYERVLQGTKVRLRPVLMTATVASLGFLPMAMSATAGAEVQRPLATVVIGGLITSTLLTLVVLPVLYVLFEKIKSKGKLERVPVTIIISIFITATGLFTSGNVSAQSILKQDTVLHLTLNNALDLAQKQNLSLKNSDLEIQYNQTLQKTAFDPGKTMLNGNFGKINEPTVNDNSIGISQSFSFPAVYIRRTQLRKEQIKSSQLNKTMTQNELLRDVKNAWYQLAYLLQKHRLLQQQDSIFTGFLHAADIRYKTGETNKLEQANAHVQVMQIQSLLKQNEADIRAGQAVLGALLNTDSLIKIQSDSLLRPMPAWEDIDNRLPENNPVVQFLKHQIQVQKAQKNAEQSLLLPDITLEANSQTFKGANRQRYGMYGIGIAVPLWPRAQIQRVKAADIAIEQAQIQEEYQRKNLQSAFTSAIEEYKKIHESMNYYSQNALPLAKLILTNAQAGYKSGEIGYIEYIENLNRASGIQNDYLDLVNQYNQAVIQLEYLTGLQ